MALGSARTFIGPNPSPDRSLALALLTPLLRPDDRDRPHIPRANASIGCGEARAKAQSSGHRTDKEQLDWLNVEFSPSPPNPQVRALTEIHKDLRDHGLAFLLARVKGEVRDILKVSKAYGR